MSATVARSAALADRRPKTGAKPLASLGWTASVAALAIALAVLGFIFAFVIAHALPALHPSLFTTVTNGVSGGLRNAIIGTVYLVAGAVVLSVLVGLGTGIWLVEYARGPIAEGVRFISDVLAGVPSIVVGYAGYALLVQRFGWGFSLAAGAIALTVVMLPYVVRGTDQALGAVPTALREGSFALGAGRVTTLFKVALPFAIPSITTALLLATGIAIGETAPLIYTAGWSNYDPSLAPVHSPVGYLTYVVWTFIEQPFAASHELAYAAAALLMVFIFLTNVVARLAIASYGRRTRGT